jgi:hypothetical protein
MTREKKTLSKICAHFLKMIIVQVKWNKKFILQLYLQTVKLMAWHVARLDGTRLVNKLLDRNPRARKKGKTYIKYEWTILSHLRNTTVKNVEQELLTGTNGHL